MKNGRGASIFTGMKKILLLLFAGLIFLPSQSFAQDGNNAAAIAEKQEAEEKYRRMSADVESVMAANLALQKKVAALENELLKLREEHSKRADDKTTAEGLKKLSEKIQEVDKKRESDKEVILSEIGKIGKTLSAPAPRQKPTVSADTSSAPEKGYPYVIQSGDTLMAILNDFNAEFKSKGMKTVTMSQVMNANPAVNWNKLRIGQKIIIPATE